MNIPNLKLPKSFRILLSFVVFGVFSTSFLLANDYAGPYATPGNELILIDNSVLHLLQFLAVAFFIIFVLGLIITVGFFTKKPEDLTLISMLQSLVASNATDPEMHHEYDGIRELDNPIPGYLQIIMYGSIVFGIVYLFHYHVLETGPLSDEEYQIEMAAAELKYKSVELPESALTLITDTRRLERAATLFSENCATCHGKKLEGDSGPNLTDPYWLHGSEVKSVYATITEGVPGKTMIGWKSKISSTQRLDLSSYILSLQGSQPANAKDPEGTLAGGATGSEEVLANDSIVEPETELSE